MCNHIQNEHIRRYRHEHDFPPTAGINCLIQLGLKGGCARVGAQNWKLDRLQIVEFTLSRDSGRILIVTEYTGSNLRFDKCSYPWGTNDADDGILTMPGFYNSGGGLWLGDAHIATMDLRLPVPKDDDPAGVVVFMNAPKGLVQGDGVALVSRRGEKLPFVVAKVDDTGTFVKVRGLAWAKVSGPVEPGDILVTSRRSLHVEKDNQNSDPSRSLGVAVCQLVGDKVLVRIARIGSASTKRPPSR